MGLTPPDSISPGKLVIDYVGLTGIRHSCSVNYMVGAYPSTRVAAASTAADLAEQLALAMPASTFTAIRWRALGWFADSKSWEETWAGGFVEEHTGTAGPYTGIDGAQSPTMTLSGRGNNPDEITQAGTCFLRLFTGAKYEVPVGKPFIPLTTDGYEDLAVLAAYLESAEDIWADAYGQKAVSNDYVTPQINAHWQKKIGL